MAPSFCPGQDRRYWRPEDICTVDCPACGYKIELFKDEGKRNCPQCGTAVLNPQVLQSCASWCDYSDACVGSAAAGSSEKNGSAHPGLAASLIDFLAGFGSCGGGETACLREAERQAAREGINSSFSAAAVKVTYIVFAYLSLPGEKDLYRLALELQGRIPPEIVTEARTLVSEFPGPWTEKGEKTGAASTDLQTLLGLTEAGGRD